LIAHNIVRHCFFIPSPKDSRDGILESLKQLVEIQSRAGGVGLNLSSLRPRGARVKKVNGTSSGPVTWAGLFSYATHDVVQQGGSRRGATMLMLWDWHPDIEEFITVKEDLSKINGAKTGRPFCGRAGDILNELLASADIKREEVFVTNIVKDRPPKNRDPLPEEIEVYGPFLDRQIKIIQPRIIATLGRYAMTYIMPKFGLTEELDVISKNHGKVFAVPPKALAEWGWKTREVKVVALYHPAVAVYNSHTKDQLKKDFQILKDL
jgi:uracil-DNA glycosylase family 4